jgi:hypothetical protein
MKPPKIEQHMRVKDVAAMLSVSPQTVRRMIENDSRVAIHGSRVTTRTKRRYRTHMIPMEVVRELCGER